jgi:16S rRNA (guanine966-N2)-methyltransferase
MRIVSGRLGGRIFAAPAGHRTHPMSDKVRGALFNTLGELNGLTVLDAFAGSGALSFEAVSRGAVAVTAIDNSPIAQKTIAHNMADLDLKKQVRLIKASVTAWLRTDTSRFDIVLADPPYDDVQLKLLADTADRSLPGGIVVMSLPPGVTPDLPADFQHIQTKDYGDAQLVFYRRIR